MTLEVPTCDVPASPTWFALISKPSTIFGPYSRSFALKDRGALFSVGESYGRSRKKTLMNPRLEQLDRVDAWLLSLTTWQLRQLALIIALTINLPNAWLMAHLPVNPATICAGMF